MTAEQRRIRRLFAVLADVASYAAGYASTELLAHAWDRISEFLQREVRIADTCCLAKANGSTAVIHATDPAARCVVRAAVRGVSDHEVGSPGWWLAIRSVAKIIDEHYGHLGSGST